LQQITTQADIIITALGLNYLKAEMVKDVSSNWCRLLVFDDETSWKGYIITGDVDFENVSKKLAYSSARRCWSNDNSHVNEKHLLAEKWNGKKITFKPFNNKPSHFEWFFIWVL
jgi:hypothetical protein